MPVITCTICRNTSSQRLDINVCTRCIRFGGDDAKLLAIRMYIEKYPNAKYSEVGKALGISYDDMNRFIERGSLRLIQDPQGELIISKHKDEKKEQNEGKRKIISQLASEYNKASQNQRRDRYDKSRLVEDLEKLRNSREKER